MNPNRAGLGKISYRIGTFTTFFEAMKARLSSAAYPGLADLRTRDSSDWSIALLDAWAAVGDILTFYQERIANEGFVRTATERLSILEVGRTVGYALRPGAAATAYLAYTMDSTADSTIPVGTRTQSTPAQGQMPQSFETADPLHATGDWNVLAVRTAAPQAFSLNPASPNLPTQLVFAGTNLNLHTDDVLLIVDPNSLDSKSQPRTLAMSAVSVTVQPAPGQTTNSQTLVTLASKTSEPRAMTSTAAPSSVPLLRSYQTLETGLLKRPAGHPANALRLPQAIETSFSSSTNAVTDSIAKAIAVVHPALESTLLPALAQAATTTTTLPVEVHVFRVNAGPFGASAPKQYCGLTSDVKATPPVKDVPDYQEWPLLSSELGTTLSLDRFYPNVVSHGYVAIMRPDQTTPTILTIAGTQKSGRAAYGISGTTSILTFASPWCDSHPAGADFSFLRGCQIYAQSEQLTLVPQPIVEPIAGQTIVLNDVYDGLDAGRWLIVSGTRTDVVGVAASELVMLSTSQHTIDPNVPGDTLHTILTLAKPLAYQYDRSTVQVFGNVVRATHGETRVEVLGSGDSSTPLQQFTLKASPLTYLSVPTEAGVQSTLQIAVNGLPWTESARFDSLGPTDRGFVTQTDNAGKTTVMFGDGIHGARLPTGVENLQATYRVGIGRSGNVDAGQLTLLASKPLGVRTVTNPLPAAGGADAETIDQGRSNIPVATAALDRIISVADYAAVARTFAGIAKAFAAGFPGASPIVHVTVAADGDATVDTKSVPIQNLQTTLGGLGDRQITLDVRARSLVVLVLAAQISLKGGAQWETVAPAIRTRLLTRFGFNARSLVQDVYLTEVIAAISSVTGVASVEVDIFDSFSDAGESDLMTQLENLSKRPGPPKLSIPARPPQLAGNGSITPAQLAIFKPELPETIVLTRPNGG